MNDGIETVIYAKIRGIHQSGRELPEISIPAENVQSLYWISKHWGLDCILEPGKGNKSAFLRALQSTAFYAAREQIFSTTGWTDVNSRLKFLMPGDENVSVVLPGKLQGYHMEHTYDAADIQIAADLLRNPPTPEAVILPLLAVTFLSPLNHFLKLAKREPKFILFLMGKTGSRKSTLAALTLSFFGRFTASELPLSFRDTANSILHNGYSLKDVLTVIDDFHPSNRQDEGKMNSTAQAVMRGFGDRVGKGRLTADCTQMNTRPPQGNAIITGEFPPDIGESGTARYFTVELQEKDVDLSLLSTYQKEAEKDSFNRCMYAYIQWLEQRFLSSEELRNKFICSLGKMFDSRRDAFNKAGLRCHGRVAETVAWLEMGMYYFLSFLTDSGCMCEEEQQMYMAQFRGILFRLAAKQASSIAQDKPTHKFIRKLYALMDSGQVTILPKNTVEDFVSSNCIGYGDENYFYLLSEISHKTVKKLCEDQGESFSLTSKALLKALAEEGLIETSSGQNTKSIRIAGKSKRLVCLSKAKAQKILEESL